MQLVHVHFNLNLCISESKCHMGLSCYTLISLLFFTSGYPLPCARTNTMPWKRRDWGTDQYSEEGVFFN